MAKKTLLLHEDTGVLHNQVRRSQGREALLTVDDVTGAISLFNGTSTVEGGGNSIIISASAPNNGDGRPNDTIYIQVPA